MKTSICKTLFSFASAACLCSCVNEEYDIEKIKFDEIHILDNASAPLGATKKFVLEELMTGLDVGKYLKTDKDGNYYLEYAGENVSSKIEVPAFHFAGYNDTNPHKTTVVSPIVFPQLKPDIVISPAIVTDPVEFEDIKFNIEVIQTDLPEEIIGVSYADVDSRLIVKLGFEASSLPFSKIWISEGAKLIFPEWIVLGAAPEGYEKLDNHTLTIVDDLSVATSNTTINIPLDGLDFTKLPDGQGIVAPGKLYLNAEVALAGSVYLSSDDYTNAGIGPFSPTLVSHINMDPMTIQSVTAAFDIESLGYTEFETSLVGLADALGDVDATIDLSGLRLNLGVSSTIPSSIDLSTTIYAAGQIYDLGTIELPAGSETASGSAYFSISQDGTGAPENYQDIAVENWNSLLSPIPESLKFSFLPAVSSDEYMTITPGEIYEVNIEYSFTSTAFGPDFRIGYSETLDGMGISLGVAEVPSAMLTLNALSTIPFNMTVAAKAIDSEGNTLDSITVGVSSDIMGGTLDNPAVTPVTLHLRASGPVELDGLIITFTASAVNDGIVLNKAQYLQLTDMSLSLPNGATIKFETNEE